MSARGVGTLVAERTAWSTAMTGPVCFRDGAPSALDAVVDPHGDAGPSCVAQPVDSAHAAVGDDERDREIEGGPLGGQALEGLIVGIREHREHRTVGPVGSSG